MEDIATVVTIVTSLATIASLGWGICTKVSFVRKNQTLGQMLTDIVDSAKKTAIASDYYLRVTSDGNLTVEEGKEFQKLAADAITSQIYAIESITGRQIYNSSDVPLPLPVGGSRTSTLPEGIVADNITPSDVQPQVVNQVTINQVNPVEQSTNIETPGAVTV
ncbi:MAG TPA: hypothetical protein VN429_10475 [Methanospirillum sp.]|uniref:hypothetical protein n=1 Tax=Methanospirillum sp. TaxID=45200 RepID=UPI002CA4F63C|nr:hypothetical protein [Methanospirillum sp.]HWQ64830.1 hypothetical protein [Methanospirillum sp.]